MRASSILISAASMGILSSTTYYVSKSISSSFGSSFGTGGKFGYAGLSKPKTYHAAQKRLSKQRKAIRARSPK